MVVSKRKMQQWANAKKAREVRELKQIGSDARHKATEARAQLKERQRSEAVPSSDAVRKTI